MRITKLALVAAMACAAIAGTAAAGSARTTKGDAEAVLNAFGNGGWAVLNHSPAAVGSPAQGLPGPVAIRPFSGTPFDGAHYCALDWHTILIADFEDGPYRAAAAIIADQRVSFTLDGAALATTQTPVKRFLRDGTEE